MLSVATFTQLASLSQGTPTLTSVSPQPANVESPTTLQLVGSGFAAITGAQLTKTGSAPLSLSVGSQTATAATLSGSFAAANPGLYSLSLTDGSGTTTFPERVELTKLGTCAISGAAASPDSHPFSPGYQNSRTDMIYLPSEIGRTGDISGIRFHITTVPHAYAGTVRIMMRQSASATFASSSFDATGWSLFYSGAFPTAVVDGGLLFSADATFAYDGTSNLQVLFCYFGAPGLTIPAATAEQFASGTTRVRWGQTDDGTIAPYNWTGAYPAARSTSTSVPKIDFEFLGTAPVAGFNASVTSAAAGDTINFTDTSSPAGTSWAWDFNRDGTVDSTAQNPTWQYSTPGLYSVELITSAGAAQDSVTRVDYINVSPAAGVDFSLNEDF
ncbi:hypothetical protein BH09SUM1_BH09SUM1_14440 [soil metagenome]